MKIFTYVRNNIRTILGVALVAVLSAGLALGGVMFYQVSRERLPRDIRQQIDFIVLYPEESDEVIVDRDTFKYSKETNALSFEVTTFGVRNVLTEQSSPESFGDIPQYYTKMIDNMYGYSSFDTDIGRVDLTRPTNLGGDQVAVINTKGVLLFAHPEKDLTLSQWRKLFNNMEVVK